MKTRIFFALLLVSLVLGISVSGQTPSKEQLGKVDFPNSCAPAVQELFQRAVAMLHSFRYAETEKAFREVLAQDPSCTIVTWGIAAILMSNPLAGVGPSPQWAERAQAAIDQGRQSGAKTPRGSGRSGRPGRRISRRASSASARTTRRACWKQPPPLSSAP